MTSRPWGSPCLRQRDPQGLEGIINGSIVHWRAFFFITASEKTAFTRKDSNEDMVTELIAHLTEGKPAVTRQSFGFTPEELIVRTQFEGQRVRETE